MTPPPKPATRNRGEQRVESVQHVVGDEDWAAQIEKHQSVWNQPNKGQYGIARAMDFVAKHVNRGLQPAEFAVGVAQICNKDDLAEDEKMEAEAILRKSVSDACASYARLTCMSDAHANAHALLVCCTARVCRRVEVAGKHAFAPGSTCRRASCTANWEAAGERKRRRRSA